MTSEELQQEFMMCTLEARARMYASYKKQLKEIEDFLNQAEPVLIETFRREVDTVENQEGTNFMYAGYKWRVSVKRDYNYESPSNDDENKYRPLKREMDTMKSDLKQMTIELNGVKAGILRRHPQMQATITENLMFLGEAENVVISE